MKRAATALFVVWLAGQCTMALAQQTWGDLDGALLRGLTRSGTAEATFWLPNTADPATASLALGFAYEHVPGSAGNTGIALGFFTRQEDGWGLAAPVQGVFGQSPRDAVFGPDHVALTTTMLAPDDARCCPTLATRWRIRYDTQAVERLN